MIIKKISQIVAASLLLVPVAFAGVIGGGSGPPARTKMELLEMLFNKPETGGLFGAAEGGLGLVVNSDLNSVITISNQKRIQSVAIPESDFLRLMENKGNIDVERAESLIPNQLSAPASRSYKVEDGESIGTLILKDRIEFMRAGVKTESVDVQKVTN